MTRAITISNLSCEETGRAYSNEVLLWRAVIEQVLDDACYPVTELTLWPEIRHRLDARKYLDKHNPDFLTVCDYAETAPADVLRKLAKDSTSADHDTAERVIAQWRKRNELMRDKIREETALQQRCLKLEQQLRADQQAHDAARKAMRQHRERLAAAWRQCTGRNAEIGRFDRDWKATSRAYQAKRIPMVAEWQSLKLQIKAIKAARKQIIHDDLADRKALSAVRKATYAARKAAAATQNANRVIRRRRKRIRMPIAAPETGAGRVFMGGRLHG